MKPVNQKIYGRTVKNRDDGDCLRGALASILEKKVEDIPHFAKQFKGQLCWQAFNLYLSQYNKVASFIFGDEHAPNKYYIAAYSVKASRRVCHAVVWRNGKVVHDPNPRKPMLDKLLYLISIDKLK